MNSLESYGLALLGGALIGLSASVVLLTHGRVAGISGLFGGLFLPGYDVRHFRLWFLTGLVAAGAALSLAYPMAFSFAQAPSLGLIAVAGLLVGFGTRLGGGCTSGHGICGICRFSRRSLAATGLFMATAIVTSLILRHLIGL